MAAGYLYSNFDFLSVRILKIKKIPYWVTHIVVWAFVQIKMAIN